MLVTIGDVGPVNLIINARLKRSRKPPGDNASVSSSSMHVGKRGPMPRQLEPLHLPIIDGDEQHVWTLFIFSICRLDITQADAQDKQQ